MSKVKFSQQKKWASPGSLIFTGTQKVEKLKIHLITYDKQNYSFTEVDSAETLKEKLDYSKVCWVNITGLHETGKIESVGRLFNIHPLAVEDILNINHSPKYESYSDYIFVIAKMIDLKNKKINIEQVSFILAKNILITFQEDEQDVFNVIRERIKNNIGRIRSIGADYLLYRLLDAIVDNYYAVLENIEDKIDEVDDMIVPGNGQISLQPVFLLRKELMKIRRAIFPLQETIHGIEREREDFITKNTYLFLRDLSDHLKYILESIESFREMITGMIEVHMSSESRRLNEVIKVLTIISTIFIPLTFVVGIYGMNFNTNVSKWNIPELNWVYGYPFIWFVMLAISGGLILFFKKKKWF